MKTPVNNDQRKAAVVIGKACLQAQLTAGDPQLSSDKLKAQLAEKWKDSRQSYVRLGITIIRKLEHAGYALAPAPGSAPRAPAKGKG